MLFRTIRSLSAVLACLLLVSAPARAAIINWEYAGTVSSNVTHYGGVNVGDTVTMTIGVDTDAMDALRQQRGPEPRVVRPVRRAERHRRRSAAWSISRGPRH